MTATNSTAPPIRRYRRYFRPIVSDLHSWLNRTCLQFPFERAQVAINAVVAEARKRDCKKKPAVVDCGGNLVAFQRMDGAMLASIQIAEYRARAAAIFRRETKFFENAIQLNNLNYLMTLDGVVASRGGIPLIEQGGIIARSVVRGAPTHRMRWSAR